MDKSRFGFQVLIAFVFLFSIVCLGINSSYSIDESSKSNWNVYFSDIEVVNNSVNNYDVPKLNGKNTSFNDVSFEVDSNGDSISYKITVINKGTVDAVIGAITDPYPKCNNADCDGLEYTLRYEDGSYVKRKDVLKVNEGKTMYLTFTYDGKIDNTIKVEDIDLSINYVER